jgi:hypothetical protein
MYIIEIFSTPQPNSGKDQFSRLLKKSKLAKEFDPMADVIVIENYHWTDFVIGLQLFPLYIFIFQFFYLVLSN